VSSRNNHQESLFLLDGGLFGVYIDILEDSDMAGKLRSPNYPALGLAQAVEAARKLWAKEKRTPVELATAARALGYSALSGPARVAIASLRQYGLVDKPDPGHVRLSERAVRIVYGTEAEQQQALAEAASTPKLFRELWQTYQDGSDDAIRSYLITKKEFTEDGAHKAIKAFRDTIKLAKPDASGYNPGEDRSNDEDMETTDAGERVKSASDIGGPKAQDVGVFQLTVPFAKGSINVQVRVTGEAMSPAHLARVRKYLELAEEDWDANSQPS
jgi:hypothetical protein